MKVSPASEGLTLGRTLGRGRVVLCGVCDSWVPQSSIKGRHAAAVEASGSGETLALEEFS
jgi:hypothetical protein